MSSEVVTNLDTLVVKDLKSWCHFKPSERPEEFSNLTPEQMEVDIEVELSHMSKPEALRFLNNTKRLVGGKETGNVDEEKYYRHLAHYIVGWRLTIGQLKCFVPLKNEVGDDAVVECNNLNKVAVLKYVPKFDDWVLMMARQLGEFQREARAEEAKNS